MEGGSVEVTVRLIDQTEGPARSATIALRVTPGGGAAGHDYAGVPERVTITAPASTGTFLVTAVEDHHYDHAETIVFGFRRPLPSGVTVGSPDTATVTIIDPGTVAMTDREVLEALYEATGGSDCPASAGNGIRRRSPSGENKWRNSARTTPRKRRCPSSEDTVTGARSRVRALRRTEPPADGLLSLAEGVLRERGAAAFGRQTLADRGREQQRVTALEQKLQRRNEILAELMDEHLALKTGMGGP